MTCSFVIGSVQAVVVEDVPAEGVAVLAFGAFGPGARPVSLDGRLKEVAMGVCVDLVVLLDAFLQQGTFIEEVTLVLSFVKRYVILSFIFQHYGFIVAFEGVIYH